MTALLVAPVIALPLMKAFVTLVKTDHLHFDWTLLATCLLAAS